jgi:hypothetical protein
MLSDPLFYAIAAACLLTLGILAFGIGGFAKGGADSGRKSNRLMRYRIAAQFVAVVLIVLFVWLRGQGGN